MSAAPMKQRPEKGAGKGKRMLRSVKSKRDDDIMNTNDSSIVSKRSVSKLYFPNEPDFYEPFVPKHVRRNPLINRGYWLRMHAVEQAVCNFLKENDKPKMVVNLGCGYDPLPFQFWHRHASLCEKAIFADVDYYQLIERKRDRILSSGLLRETIFKHDVRPADGHVYLRTDHYVAIGCDLRDLKTLEKVLKDEMQGDTYVLFVAEVSVTYMPLADSNELIRWASTFPNAQFCLLEQFLPQGPQHPFAKTMLEHFNKLQTPIYAVKDYPSLDHQASRFSNAGWATVNARNLWDLWSDESLTPRRLRGNLDSIEPFDEWEEFALFAGHYFMIMASTTPDDSAAGAPVPASVPQLRDDRSAPIQLNYHVPPTDTPLTPRRFGAAYAAGEQAVAYHGGQGLQGRLSTVDTLRRENLKPDLQSLAMQPARVCHTITNINGLEALLVGGRKSPTQALADTWLIKSNGDLQQVEDLSPARFRHCAVKVTVPFADDVSDAEGVLVFGGKSSDGIVLEDCKLWRPNHGWTELSTDASRPPARFGAAISSVGSNWGLIVGGLNSDGTVLDDIWEYRLTAASSGHLRLEFVDRTNDVRSSNAASSHARFGASLVPFGDSLLLVGGICKKEIISFREEILMVSVGSGITIESASLELPPDALFLPVGCGVTPVGSNEIVVAGGGVVCFSMGSFWNQGFFTITRPEQHPSPLTWSVSKVESAAALQSNAPKPPKNKDKGKGKGKGKKNRDIHNKGQDKSDSKRNVRARPGSQVEAARDAAKVQRIEIRSEEDFAQLVSSSKPAIIEGLDLGPCTSLWTLEYLKDKVGVEREVVVHECSSDRMTFKDKNFQYTKTSFGAFIDGISEGGRTYLRAASSTQPNKLPTSLAEDFPAIAQDFQIPSLLTSIIADPLIHSSPLRISGPVSLWLHYDVLANVLCQIRGTKTLHLYPPSDVQHLDFPPGGSSSNTNVLDSSSSPSLTHTSPHIVALKPGDVLFIPPMWSHTATPQESYSVAVNVFWRNLEKGYAAGKDVYGNRDLQAYETGRRDVEKIVRAFRDIPGDIRGFYLRRLGMELWDKAEDGERKESAKKSQVI